MTDRVGNEHARRDDPDALFDARSDPAGVAFGTLGAEAGSDLNWFAMLRHRVQKRATGSSRYEWWVLWALLAGLLSLNFTFTVFNLILTQVARELHTTTTAMTWTSLGPTLAYGLAAPAFGKLGDIFGHRRLYLFGLAGAMVSAAATALAPTLGLLILARTIDGVAGAASGSASGALLNLVFRPEERVKAGGWWSLVGAGGPVLGVSIGAPIISMWGWRSLFWIQLGLIVVAFAVVAMVLPHIRHSEEVALERKARARAEFKTMDWIGSWTLSFSIVSLMLALTFGSSLGWTSLPVFAGFIFSVLGIFAFAYRLRHAQNPLIPIKYFRRRLFVWPLLVRTTSSYAYFAGFFLFPFLMQYGYGASINQTGALAIARPITFALCAPIAGYVAVRIGERTTALAGATFLTISMLLFATLHPSTGTWVIIAALALSGLGQGVAMPSAGAIMANEVDPSEFGVMSAAQLLANQVGQVAGIQVSFTIEQALLRHRGLTFSSPHADVLATFQLPMLIGAGFAAFSLFGSFFFKSVPRDGSRRNLAQADDHSL